MATVPMLAGVGLMVVCSSSIAAFMMMGGEEETPDAGAGSDPLADDADLDEDATADDDAPDCSSAQTNWINGNMKSKGFSQSQGEHLQKCKVTTQYQPRIEDITYCDVAKTDWINNQIKQADRRNTFEQASNLQNCTVPHNLRSRITNKSCTVPQIDWINNKMGNDDWSQDQGEAAQNCFVPDVYKGRITN